MAVEVPFIDRETSLAKLNEISRHPDGYCLLVVGRQGIGKSRLLKRFAEEAMADSAATLICVYHESYRTSSSLQEFSRLEDEIAAHPAVRPRLGLKDGESWTPYLARWLSDSAAALDPTPGKALSHLPVEQLIREVLWARTTLDEGEILESFLRSLRHVSRVLREDQRLVMLIDPGANFDEGSTDLRKLKILYDVVRNLPPRVVLIVALRDTDPAAHSTDFLVLPNVELYKDLEPFVVGDVHLLLSRVFGEDFPFEVAHHVHRKYGGDPFATEMAILCASRERSPRQALVDDCPEKLLELMGLYHDGFPEPFQRRALRALSVLDEPAPLGLASALLDAAPDRETLLRTLRAPEMTRAVVEVPPLGDMEPRFRVYHQAFAGFLRERAEQYGEAQDLNRKAGRHYAEIDHPALALYHFGLAADLEGVRANLERGLEWHRIQGEGLRLLRVEELLRRQPLSARERFLVGKAVAWAYSLSGESDQVLERLDELLPAATESTEKAELLLLRGDCLHNASRYQESQSSFEAARALLEEAGETGTLLYRQVLLESAHMLTHLGAFQASEALHGRLLATQRFPAQARARIELLVQSAREIRRYGEVLVFTGQWEEAERLLQLARRQFAHLGHRRGEGDALRRIADLHLLRGGMEEYARALQTARRAQELLTEVGSRGASFMAMVIGEAERGLGRFAEARHTFQRSAEELADGESAHLLSMAEIGLAECERLASGEPRLDLYSRALERYEAISSDWGIATTRFYRGLAHLTANDRGAALSDLAGAREIFTRLGLDPPLKAIGKVVEAGEIGFYPIIVL